MRVAVVGAGIAGLAAAWELTSSSAAEVTVLDPGPPGGKIRTAEIAGHPVEDGPDAFLSRVPEAVSLCRELGLSDELVAPAAGRAMLWAHGRLRPLPDGLVLGVPRRLGPLLGSGILSPWGMARAALDLVLPRRKPPGDLTVAELVGGRFGREVVDLLVDPLVGGIHAGRTDELSAAATVPQLLAAYRSGPPSLLWSLQRAPAAPPGPVFLAPRAGLGRVVQRLVGQLGHRSVTMAHGEVAGVDAWPGAVEVSLRNGRRHQFDAVVLATPPPVTAGLLHHLSPGAAQLARTVPMASVAVVTLAYPASAFKAPAGVSGFLVPRGDGRLMTACSFASNKWPHWSDPDVALVRLSTGRIGDSRPWRLDDDGLLRRLREELALALGHPLPPPIQTRVSRWPEAFPQYLAGHLERVERAERQLAADAPHVVLAGAGLRGSGIPACIGSGRRAARLLLERA